MTRTVSGELGSLRLRTAGRVIGPDEVDYDDARRVWNGEIDRRPAVIVRCADAADVSTAIGFARDNGLEITVRGGAHNAAGTAVADGALMIDLSRLDTVQVDPPARRARVGGGAALAQLDAAAQEHGLATPAGTVSHTGVGGLTLGGGMGWLTRKFGLALDNVTAVEIVTADGAIRRAAADENPDLFWAVRGGGGNFGVVTEFEFRLHEVDPMVEMALCFWSLDRATEALRVARDVSADLPRDLNLVVAGINAPAAPFVPEPLRGTPGVAMVLVGFGAAEQHAAVAERIRTAQPPAFEVCTPMPYVALQQMFDEGNAWGLGCYEKSTYLSGFSDDVIAVIAEHLPRKTSPLTQLIFLPLDGAYTEVAESDTAFGGGRTPRLTAFILGLVSDLDTLPAERAWVRSFWEALQPYAMGAGTYVNAVEPAEGDRVRASYGPKYERLAAVKAVYDPDNVFHGNANIRPAAAPR
ncbi:FAD-binding oxidoreductase [Pseudonocardia bannensis]|uniref:FAD-binding oxidoreductase n=1 Tax=Pseudonocardia bannensis TaxID=630973 RepID=A0A848DRB2_9PSEU|nr:FAD-binding oxidoreductase [Pseudonocardia bannensis]NMH95342.1 FAD-binding oxidoreductase [Pseudonocardia bannensis]